jgi:iron complex outermembrane receptor protein
LPGASDWTGNLQVTFVTPLGDALNLTIGVLGYLRSEYTTASDASPAYGEQDDYEKIDARIEVAAADERWALALVGKNLTDEFTHNFAYLWPISPPPTGIQFLDETRTVALEGRLNF